MSPILGQLLVILACVLALVSAMGLTPESSFPPRITVKLVDGLEIRLSERRVSGTLAPKQESAPPIQKKGVNGQGRRAGLLNAQRVIAGPCCAEYRTAV